MCAQSFVASIGVCGWTCNLEGEQTWKDSNINEVQFWAPAVLCWIAFPRIENTIDILLFRRVVSTEILHIIHLDIVQESSLIFIITCPGHSTKTISLLLAPNLKLWFVFVYISFWILFHFHSFLYSLLTKFRTTYGEAAYATVIFPVKTRRPILHRGEYRKMMTITLDTIQEMTSHVYI
jgi:hypothetical protein